VTLSDRIGILFNFSLTSLSLDSDKRRRKYHNAGANKGLL
jgi:hypothetical protein